MSIAARAAAATRWKDTKHVASQLGVSNRKVLALLDKEGITQKNNAGVRCVTAKGKPYARLNERSWIYGGRDSECGAQQPYWVVQLNSYGVGLVNELLETESVA